jgi:hypothetical protein
LADRVIVVRAWPQFPPPGRSHVVDLWPKTQVDDYDYRTLADLHDDVIVMDWDTAADLRELRGFAGRCRGCAVPRVVPCLMYQDGDNDLPGPVWNAKVYERSGQSMRYVAEGEPVCDLFGFGLTYLPQALIRGFMAAWPGRRMDDMSFSGWWYRHSGGRQTVLDWGVRPVHLHYAVPADGRL